MTVDGKPYAPGKPSDALQNGVAYVPAERKSEGINAIASVKDNITVANLRKFAPKGIMNLKQDSICLELRSKMTDVDLEIAHFPVALSHGPSLLDDQDTHLLHNQGTIIKLTLNQVHIRMTGNN